MFLYANPNNSNEKAKNSRLPLSNENRKDFDVNMIVNKNRYLLTSNSNLFIARTIKINDVISKKLKYLLILNFQTILKKVKLMSGIEFVNQETLNFY